MGKFLTREVSQPRGTGAQVGQLALRRYALEQQRAAQRQAHQRALQAAQQQQQQAEAQHRLATARMRAEQEIAREREAGVGARHTEAMGVQTAGQAAAATRHAAVMGAGAEERQVATRRFEAQQEMARQQATRLAAAGRSDIAGATARRGLTEARTRAMQTQQRTAAAVPGLVQGIMAGVPVPADATPQQLRTALARAGRELTGESGQAALAQVTARLQAALPAAQAAQQQQLSATLNTPFMDARGQPTRTATEFGEHLRDVLDLTAEDRTTTEGRARRTEALGQMYATAMTAYGEERAQRIFNAGGASGFVRQLRTERNAQRRQVLRAWGTHISSLQREVRDAEPESTERSDAQRRLRAAQRQHGELLRTLTRAGGAETRRGAAPETVQERMAARALGVSVTQLRAILAGAPQDVRRPRRRRGQ